MDFRTAEAGTSGGRDDVAQVAPSETWREGDLHPLAELK